MHCWFAADRGAARGGHCKSNSALPRVRRRSLQDRLPARRIPLPRTFRGGGMAVRAREP
jgi:hypothetical protein